MVLESHREMKAMVIREPTNNHPIDTILTSKLERKKQPNGDLALRKGRILEVQE
jgi:hypothetical protein